MTNPEALFQHRSLAKLRRIKGLWCFTKEAAALRGIPDIIGVCNGRFFAWELKTSMAECRRKTGRTVLQRYTLDKINEAGGIGRFVCPKNFVESLEELKSL